MAPRGRGKMQLARGSHSAGNLIRAALDSMRPALEGREVRLRVAAGLPPVAADADLIALTLRQLIDNALKYSPAGSPIVVSARAGESSAVISVADSGQGITENQQRRIFDKFYRVPVEGEPVSGTGMGLTIARKILDAHSGSIWVESSARTRLGIFYFPPYFQRGIARVSAGAHPGGGNDEPQIRRVMRTALTANGYEVSDVRSGEEAVETLRHSSFDLVLLDMNLPGLDGVATCRSSARQPAILTLPLLC